MNFLRAWAAATPRDDLRGRSPLGSSSSASRSSASPHAKARPPIVLGSANGQNVGLVALFDDTVQKLGHLKAGQVLGAAAKKCGGGGGGKPGFAQAGGRDASQLDDALRDALDTVTDALSS